jgi:type IV secretion system protein VirB9
MKTRFVLTSVVLALTGMHASAQTAATPPASLTAAPAPAAAPAPVKVVPALETAQACTPGCAAPAPVVKPKPVVKRVAAPVTPIREKVEVIEPKTDATSDRAVNQSKDWLTAENRPTVGDDGRVMFTYGAGLPVVVCAPLRICVVELQPGERVNKEVQLGDSVRWIVTPAESGSGKGTQTLVVIKPKEVGLDTNLLIPTDKRNYYIRLISRSSDYIARVAFSYPEEAKAAWEAYSAKRAELAKSEVAPNMPAMSIERLKFDYSIDGDASFKPIRVVDNGEKTYIQLPATAKADEIPVLVVLNSEGKEQLVNSRFINGWYEVDRLFDRAALILGVGSEQRKVVITNNARYKRSFWNFGGER